MNILIIVVSSVLFIYAGVTYLRSLLIFKSLLKWFEIVPSSVGTKLQYYVNGHYDIIDLVYNPLRWNKWSMKSCIKKEVYAEFEKEVKKC